MRLPRELLSAVVDTAACLICVDDADGRLVLFNRACEELTGFTFEEIRELGTASLVPPEELPAVKAICESHCSVEQPFRHENHWICKDGSRRLIAWTNTSVTDGEAVAFVVATGIDVTEARQAEEALRASGERTRKVLEAALDAVIGMDGSGRVVFWSSQAAAIFGWPETEAIGAQLAELIIPPDQRAAHRRGLRHFLETGEGPILGQRVEVTAIDRAGRLFPVELDIVAVGAGDGLTFTAFVRDITDRKQAEAKLRESEERFRAMADSAPVLIWMSDADGQPLFFNHGWHEFTGRGFDEEIDAGGWVGVHEDDVEVARVLFERALDEHSPYDAEYRLRRADGEYRRIRDRAVARFLPDGTFAGLTGVAVDVTDQRDAEQVLRDSEEHLRAVLDNEPALVWMTDENAVASFFNRGWLEFTGRTLEEELGRGWEDATHPDDLKLVLQAYEAAFGGRTGYELEYRLLRHDGEWRWVLERANPRFDAEGRFIGLTGTTVDITEQREAEHALRESEERLRHLFDITPAMIWMTDPDDRLTFLSRAGVEFTGRTLEEELGLGWEGVTHPDDVPLVYEAYELAREGRQSSEVAYRLLRHDGEWRWVLERANPRFDAEGRFIGLTGTTFDITEQREAEHALKESEARLRHVLEITPAMIWATGTSGTLTFLSRNGLEFTGRTLEESLARDWDLDVHPQDLQRMAKAYDGAVASQTGYEVEYRMRRHDGQYRWVFERGSPHFDAEGRFSGLTGATFDITEQREAEQALKESEARLRHLFEITPAIIWMTDPDGLVTFFSRSGIEFVGGDLGDSLGRNWELDIHPDDLPGLREAYDAAVARQTGYELEFRLRRHDGQYRWVVDRGRPHFDAAGAFAGLTGATFDITERREMEEALRESEEQFRQLAENVEDVFWLADPRGSPIFYLSPAFERVWGRPRADFLADPHLFAESMHPDDLDAQLGRVDDLARDEFDVQYRIVRPDGSIRWIRDRSFHVHDEQGEVVRVAGIAIDITEIKRANEERRALEEQVRHAQKLESLGVLAGGIAHDFNNLLMGILGNAGLALAELPLDSPSQEAFRKIETASLRAAELTNQMLAYAGKGRFVVAPIDLSRLVEEMAHLLSAAISKKAVLRFDLATDLPAVEADASQLNQVVMNLITNASDALGDDSGVIAVQTGVMDVDRRYLTGASAGEELEPGRYVFVEVADTGVGMDAETKRRIFEPFFTTKFTGRGLGLAGTLGIVRSHGGAITVDSEPGRGTTARVVLPPSVRQAAVVPAPSAAPEEPPAQAGIVLVVDDDEAVRGVALTALERAGFAVLTAADGREALDVFRSRAGEIAAVVLDLTMPVMGGKEVLRELQASHAGVPVVLSSGYTEEDATTQLEGNGVAGFVQKPYRPSELTAKVLEVLGR